MCMCARVHVFVCVCVRVHADPVITFIHVLYINYALVSEGEAALLCFRGTHSQVSDFRQWESQQDFHDLQLTSALQ